MGHKRFVPTVGLIDFLLTEAAMRVESRVTSLSWIPSEAAKDMLRMEFSTHVAEYDDPPHRGGLTCGIRVEDYGVGITYLPDHVPAESSELADGVDLFPHDVQYLEPVWATAHAYGHRSRYPHMPHAPARNRQSVLLSDGEIAMRELILLLGFSVFAIGILVGVRCQEINLRGRERRLAEERRRMNARIRALRTHHEVNNLIWQARNELRQAALLQTEDMPVVIDHELEVRAVPSMRNGATLRPTQGRKTSSTD